jgi:hypothetical protein
MAMSSRVSTTPDAESEAALIRIMKRTGWTKSQVIREAIRAVAELKPPAKRLMANRRIQAEAKRLT